MIPFENTDHPHRRYNPLLGEWILVSPHRAKRPWLGQNEAVSTDVLPEFDPTCYLCPGNVRANGIKNDDYRDVFIFDNDFPALLSEETHQQIDSHDLFRLAPERGINRVVCFSPRHDLTLAEMDIPAIEKVVSAWNQEYVNLGAKDFINHVQIFENKGSVMGASNPHPHGQIWAQSSLPTQIIKTQANLKAHFEVRNKSLLEEYLSEEALRKERIVSENDHFICLVPLMKKVRTRSGSYL